MDYKTKILSRLERVEDLPTLPTIALEVNRMLMDVETSIKDLSETIKRDQAMVPKILKLVNSAFYGFSSRIASVDRAIVLLGYNTVRNAVLSVSIVETFGKDINIATVSLEDFWVHASTVAVVSRHLAASSRFFAPEDAFTAGLIHDIGKIILIKFFPEAFKEVWDTARQDQKSFFEVENQVLNIAHTRIGATLARRWKFPEEIVDSIRNHHFYAEAGEEAPGLRTVVRAANLIAKRVLGKPLCPSEVENFERDILHFQPVMDIRGELSAVLQAEIDSACGFFVEGGIHG